MFLKRLSIINFKNIEEADIHFSDRINFFIGENATGKTNLLDTIYYLCFCKSQISETDLQNIQHHKSFMTLKGVFQRNNTEEIIFCKIQNEKKKRFYRNNKVYAKLAEHIGLLPLVMISPFDQNIITGRSEKRKRFMDKVIMQYDNIYLAHLIRYNRILAQRNKLLKNYAINLQKNNELLSILNFQLVKHGKYIYQARKDFCGKIAPYFQHYYNLIAGKFENVSIAYQSQLVDTPFLTLLENSLAKDKVMQYTTKGVHRDDLELLLNGYSIKKEGSQGQKKTYLVALKFSQFELLKKINGIKPILILDDIFDKLDVSRFQQIINIIEDERVFGQIFISDTSKLHFLKMNDIIPSDMSIFTMEEGKIYKDEKKSSTKN